MKRLYVRKAFQGRGCGLFLAAQDIEWAKRAGYDRMLLDTLPAMTAAQHLYERLGFREADPYRFNPIPGTRYMELPLVAFPQVSGNLEQSADERRGEHGRRSQLVAECVLEGE